MPTGRTEVLEFRVLGPLEVSRGERPVVVGGERVRGLLALLLVHANELMSTERLVDVLFAERPQVGGVKALQVAVARLRRALGRDPDGGVLRTRAGGYVLELAAGQLDVAVFERLFEEGRALVRAGDPDGGAVRLGEALSLWRGEPLADLATVDYLQSGIRRWEQLRSLAIMERIDAELALGYGPELIAELEALVARDPLEERLRAQLMLALYRAGRQADALDVFRTTRGVLADELGLEPSRALRALQADILTQNPALDGPEHVRARVAPTTAFVQHDFKGAHRGVIVMPPTPTIGRVSEIHAVSMLLADPEGRLVTLVGAGGVGKTRLALEVVHAVRGSFADDACWVSLESVEDPDDVTATIVRGIGLISRPGEDAADLLLRHLADKEFLLVVDNFEHVLESGGLLAALHGSCPKLTVLVTSREALNIAAEQTFAVMPLPLPESSRSATAAEIEASDATALFLASARRHDPGFSIGPGDPPIIARIAAQLDGLPLALELAAANVRFLGLGELDAQLTRMLEDPGGGRRDAPARHRTLHNAIGWSYNLLDEDERAAFARFSVFAGGATLDATVTVTRATVESIRRLHDKNLIIRHQQPDGSTRLTFLNTVRQFALGLADLPDCEATRQRHFDYYMRLVADNSPNLATTRQREAVVVLDRDIDNIRSAITWALDAAPTEALHLASHFDEYLRVRNDLRWLGWVEAALLAAGEHAPLRDRARAELVRANALGYRRRERDAIGAAERAVELYARAGDHAGMSEGYIEIAVEAAELNLTDKRDTAAREAWRLARRSGDARQLGRALACLAPIVGHEDRVAALAECTSLLLNVGDYMALSFAYSNCAYEELKEGRLGEARSLLELAQAAARPAENPVQTIAASVNTGVVHLFSGEPWSAWKLLTEQLQLLSEFEFHYVAGECVAGLAAVAVCGDHLAKAAHLRGAASAIGYPTAGERPVHDRMVREYFQAGRARHGAAAWDLDVDVGSRSTYDEAIRYAVATTREIRPPNRAPSGETV